MEKAVTGGKPPVLLNYYTICMKRERSMIFVRLCKYGGGWSLIIRLPSNFPENFYSIKIECILIILHNNINLIRM